MQRSRPIRPRGGKRVQESRRTVSRPYRLLTALAIVGVLAGVRLWSPEGSAAVGKFVDENLAGSADYGSALAALGEAVAGEGELAEVWNAFDSDAVDVDADPLDAVEVGNIDGDAASGGGDFALGLESTPASVTLDEINESVDPGCEELLLPFPESEEDDTPSDAPDTVSYDYLVLDFDYVMPTDGVKTSGFGYRIHPITGKRSFHYGVDIGAPQGTDIVAFADGTVELVDYNSVYGNYLFIRHADGILTFYGHCSKVTAVEGQLVSAGDVVAKVGSTGWSTGPHLHFEVRSGDTILDPTNYLNFD